MLILSIKTRLGTLKKTDHPHGEDKGLLQNTCNRSDGNLGFVVALQTRVRCQPLRHGSDRSHVRARARKKKGETKEEKEKRKGRDEAPWMAIRTGPPFRVPVMVIFQSWCKKRRTTDQVGCHEGNMVKETWCSQKTKPKKKKKGGREKREEEDGMMHKTPSPLCLGHAAGNLKTYNIHNAHDALLSLAFP